MKVFAISDLHLSINNPKPMDIFGPAWDNYIDAIKLDWQQKVSPDDIVIIAGDISWAMSLSDAVVDLEYISKTLGVGKKVIIRGNHDYWWDTISKVRKQLPENVYAIQNDSIKFDGVVLCGTRGWVLPETKTLEPQDQKIVDREAIRLEMTLKSAQEKATNGEEIICIMHYPPFNSRREDSPFTKLIEQYGVKKVVYGHLHGTGGKSDLVVHKNGVTYYLTSCDKLSNQLVLIKE